MLKICQNASGSTILVMGRRGHDLLSWLLSSYTLQILLLLSSLPSTNWYDGPFQARRSVEGLRFITLKLLGNWVLGLLSHHHDEPAGRLSWLQWSVMNFVIPHLVRLPHLPSLDLLRFHLHTITCTMDCHMLRRW